MKKVKLIVVGAGSRGYIYSSYALENPTRAEIVAVAEPCLDKRNRLAQEHNITSENVFNDWREIIKKPKFADGVIIATNDHLHCEPAIAFSNKGYNMLLEKPMAPNEQDCLKIVNAAVKNKIIFAVCHVMRYTNYTKHLKKIIESGTVGEVVSMQHLEPVGYWHYAHSYVRGKWRKESESSSMLLGKCCHDLDWICYIMGKNCHKISSFGSLFYFRKEKQPAESAQYCIDCTIEQSCPYSSKKIYLNRLKNGHKVWPVDVLSDVVTEENIIEALKTGPYGRCVWACDNDVVDNQVVNMFFETGKTANLTVTAFTEMSDRKTRIFGTKGRIEGDGSKIEIFDFLTERKTVVDVQSPDGSILGGHGGGDYSLMEHFVDALAFNDPTKIFSGPQETLETHLITFNAEKSRLSGTVICL